MQGATIDQVQIHVGHPGPSGRPEGKPVGEAARAIGVTPHVLRHWEHERVLVPARDEYGHRRYSSADLAVAAGIRRAQAAGLTLAQVRDFLGGDADAREALLAAHRRDLDAHRDALARASADVTAALGAPVDPHCPYGV